MKFRVTVLGKSFMDIENSDLDLEKWVDKDTESLHFTEHSRAQTVTRDIRAAQV